MKQEDLTITETDTQTIAEARNPFFMIIIFISISDITHNMYMCMYILIQYKILTSVVYLGYGISS